MFTVDLHGGCRCKRCLARVEYKAFVAFIDHSLHTLTSIWIYRSLLWVLIYACGTPRVPWTQLYFAIISVFHFLFSMSIFCQFTTPPAHGGYWNLRLVLEVSLKPIQAANCSKLANQFQLKYHSQRERHPKLCCVIGIGLEAKLFSQLIKLCPQLKCQQTAHSSRRR